MEEKVGRADFCVVGGAVGVATVALPAGPPALHQPQHRPHQQQVTVGCEEVQHDVELLLLRPRHQVRPHKNLDCDAAKDSLADLEGKGVFRLLICKKISPKQ